jgi:radical SAM protein with 4Fe4S-binding SPASM domain
MIASARRAGPALAAAALLILGGCGGGSAEPGPAVVPAAHHGQPSSAGGFVAGLAVPSRALYDALLPDPHDAVLLSDIQCPECRAAIAGDGLCGNCGMGWVGGRGHVTRYSYYVARGHLLDAPPRECPTCVENARGTGWCDRCRIGMLGDLAYRDRRLYDEAAPSFRVMLASIAKLRECESCAIAMTCDGRCPVHWTSFRGGRAVAGASPGPPARAGSS